MGKILILYGLPMVTVGAMGIPYRRKIQSPLQTLRDLNIKIAPTELKIFSVFQESEPLFVKVENQGRDIHKYTLRVDLPEEVIAKYDGQEFADEIVNEGEVKPEGRPDSAARYNIRLKYSGNEIRSGLIEVQIEHSAGSVEKDVETLLVPQ
ncbi:hypothetical protein C492_16548 [Natronococcus jeotgali DSM 18795]|uniref:Uncharacterized protein n=2 Tax=Natronococcus jeotgali TaxID=413812 RepID=L9WXK7_9EURY|nr:hypothetical protein C492_16548 [Natronococcus jeotgali DSM 18795]